MSIKNIVSFHSKIETAELRRMESATTKEAIQIPLGCFRKRPVIEDKYRILSTAEEAYSKNELHDLDDESFPKKKNIRDSGRQKNQNITSIGL